jgi:O-antigen/teichoic acid export membrane protein
MWLVIAFLPVAAAAEYKIGAWQLPLVTTVAYSTGNSFLPRYTELYAAGRAPEAIALWHGTIRKLSLLAIPMGTAFMVGADAFVVGVFGEAYARSGSVLRAYAFLTAGRVAAFGPMLVAAGRPGLLAWAAAFTLVSNLVISLPLVVSLGFVGPALGTAIAFVPMVGFYCVAIARASGCPVWGIFPLASIARVVAATLPGVVGALALEAYGGLPPLLAFAGISGIVFGSFAIVATATGIVTRDDWVYVRRWLGLRVF